MLRTLWKMFGPGALCGAALLAGASFVPAQDKGLPTPIVPPVNVGAPKTSGLGIPTPTVGAPTNNEAAELKARVERLERQNQELMDMLKGLKKTPAASP